MGPGQAFEELFGDLVLVLVSQERGSCSMNHCICFITVSGDSLILQPHITTQGQD
jgi:hypothetical protein